MSQTIDELMTILKKAKKELSGDTEVVLTMNPAGTLQGHIDCVHVVANQDKKNPCKPVLAIYSLNARRYRLKER